jgi:restriction endonuclease Mrr
MPVPDFQSIMLPFLQTLEDGAERSMREMGDLLAAKIFTHRIRTSRASTKRTGQAFQQPRRLGKDTPKECWFGRQSDQRSCPHLRTGAKRARTGTGDPGHEVSPSVRELSEIHGTDKRIGR